ncbi:MAG: hypothetical protein AAGJ10_20400, partial [Bacteroidota bacterium]
PGTAMLPDGRFAIVWMSDDSGTWNLTLQRYAADGTTVGSVVSVASTGDHHKLPVLAAAGSGTYVAAWQRVPTSGASFAIEAITITSADGALGTLQTAASGSTYLGHPALDAADTSGRFVVAWQGRDGDGSTGVFAQRYAADATADGSVIALANTTTGEQLEPGIGMNDATDAFVASWTSGTSLSDTDVLLRRFAADGTPAADAATVNTTTSGTQRQARPAFATRSGNLQGRIAVAWDSYGQDGSFDGVYVQRYDTTGQAIGTESIASTTTDGFQQDAAVAYPRANLPIRLVWQSGLRSEVDTDGNAYDVVRYDLEALSALSIAVALWLEGPYSTANDNMTVALSSSLPQSDPYSLGESVASADFFTTDTNGQNVVDWITVELRTGDPSASSMTLVAQVPALLMQDGSVKALDAASDLSIASANEGSYYLAVGHRNHLSVISATVVDCSSGTCTYDFRSASTQAFGADPMAEVEAGVWALLAGDGTNNGQVQNDDKNTTWAAQVGSSGYLGADYNLNGQVQNDDKNTYWANNVGKGTNVVTTD